MIGRNIFGVRKQNWLNNYVCLSVWSVFLCSWFRVRDVLVDGSRLFWHSPKFIDLEWTCYKHGISRIIHNVCCSADSRRYYARLFTDLARWILYRQVEYNIRRSSVSTLVVSAYPIRQVYRLWSAYRSFLGWRQQSKRATELLSHAVWFWPENKFWLDTETTLVLPKVLHFRQHTPDSPL